MLDLHNNQTLREICCVWCGVCVLGEGVGSGGGAGTRVRVHDVYVPAHGRMRGCVYVCVHACVCVYMCFK